MKRKIRVLSILLIVLVLLFLTACNKSRNTSGNTNTDNPITTVSATPTEDIVTKTPTEQISTSSASNTKKEADIILKPYDDIRDVNNKKVIFEENEYRAEDIITFTFNKGTVLKGNEKLQDEIMENGKNPGLGISELHKEGLTICWT